MLELYDGSTNKLAFVDLIMKTLYIYIYMQTTKDSHIYYEL